MNISPSRWLHFKERIDRKSMLRPLLALAVLAYVIISAAWLCQAEILAQHPY